MPESIEKTKYYSPFISYMKAIAAVFVILVHMVPWDNNLKFFYSLTVFSALPLFIIIMGFNWCNSYLRMGINSFKELYNGKWLSKRILRILIPFLIFFIFEMILVMDKPLSLSQLAKDFLYGGIGPGRNMLPILLQFILVFPLVYKFIKSFDFKGVISLVIINILFEYIVSCMGIPRSTYMIIALRYLTCFALGVYLSFKKCSISDYMLVAFFVISFLYFYCISFIGVVNPFKLHGLQGAPGQLWYFLVFYLCYRYFYKVSVDSVYGKAAEVIGKASWHIFLIQMFYFASYSENIEKYVRLYMSDFIGYYYLWSVIICVLAGVIFYKIDSKFISGKLKIF